MVVIFVLGTTGIAAAVRFDDSGGMEPFCGAYEELLRRGPPEPPFSAVLDAEQRAAVEAVGRVVALGRASGNEKVERVFRNVEAADPLDVGPRAAEVAGKAYVDSFGLAVEECAAAGIDILPNGP